jgi:hypothetical protein
MTSQAATLEQQKTMIAELNVKLAAAADQLAAAKQENAKLAARNGFGMMLRIVDRIAARSDAANKAGDAHRAAGGAIASILAARMKSFSESPPIA